MAASVAYERYAPVLACVLPHFERYERLFAYGGYALSFVAVLVQSGTTLLHLPQSSFGAPVGIWLGAASTATAAVHRLLPLGKATTDCREAAAVIARHLASRQPIPLSRIVHIYDAHALWLTHPTARAGCALDETFRPRDRASMPTVGRPTTQSGADTRALLNAAAEFEILAHRFFAAYYALALVQLVATVATAALHGVGDDSTLGLLVGGVGTVASSALAIVPVELAAHQCRKAYAFCVELVLRERPPDEREIEALRRTHCLGFRNPYVRESTS